MKNKQTHKILTAPVKMGKECLTAVKITQRTPTVPCGIT